MRETKGTGISRRAFCKTLAGAAVSATVMGSSGKSRASDGNAKRIRVAVVGGNFGATFWWHEHPNCVVTAVTDLIPERRENLVRRYSCLNAFESLEVMLKKAPDTFDAVAVFSGAPEHVKHSVMCMNAGKHVISAVPAALTLEECQLLKETKENTGLKYMMAESSYYRQECIAAREMYQAGKFGNLFYSEVEYYHNFICTYPSQPDVWRYGFPPMLYPTHSTGFFVGVTKERLVEVSCLGTREEPFPRPEENVYRNPFSNEIGLFKTDRGNVCRANVCWRIAAGGERAQWFGTEMSAYMSSSGGLSNSIEIADKGRQPWNVLEYWKTDPSLPERMRHASGHGGSAVFITAEFINALVENREPTIDVYESLAMTTPGIVAHQSALKRGEQLKVPSFDAGPKGT
ncbi:MAG: Gfo/Idh/MocA family oxidoreductase [bacterium]|nr:Gfo/Idh/MocA family oxidoreductase [bacterium]